MGLEKVTSTIGKEIIAWTRTSGKSLITSKPKMVNIDGLKFSPQIKGDAFQIHKSLKNTIKMEPATDGKFLFYDGDSCIGKVLMGGSLRRTALPGELPSSWYVPNGTLCENNQLPAYPILHIDEIIIKDKKGFFEHYQKRADGKKYGTMCMQKILEYAEKNGYGSRISLDAEKWGSNIHPGKFYAKIGFEPGPSNIKYLEKINERYYKGQEYAKKYPNLPEEVLSDYLDRPFIEQIDGRFITDGRFGVSRLFLTHPEVLKNYPI